MTSPRSARGKILSVAGARAQALEAHGRGETVVFTNGCFDLLHVGHLRSLEQARGLGDRLIVGINEDASVAAAKGADRPIRPVAERIELVAGLGCVDWVVAFAEPTPLELILEIQPDVLAKGGDWALDEIVGRAEVESWGGRVARLEITPGHSTTSLVERIRRRGARAKR